MVELGAVDSALWVIFQRYYKNTIWFSGFDTRTQRDFSILT